MNAHDLNCSTSTEGDTTSAFHDIQATLPLALGTAWLLLIIMEILLPSPLDRRFIGHNGAPWSVLPPQSHPFADALLLLIDQSL